MVKLIEHQLRPDELLRELEARAYGQTALVILSINQWKLITDAYHSPLVENIANSALQVFPQREVESKELSFRTYAREFKR